MRYLSVCSGIEAATVAWHPLGWEPAAFAEIEPMPSAVLAHHYPTVQNHGDFTTIRGDEYGAIDLIVGGTPCQSFSVAGLHGGMDDERGNLALEFCRLAERIQPRWIVWENVPGVLSNDGGRAFGSIVGALAEIGYGCAWRILDAQYIRVQSHPRAVPQRRRRVFVIGYLGDWRPPVAVLFEPESMQRNPPPSRKARAKTPGASEEHFDQRCHTVAPTIGASGAPYDRPGNERVETQALVTSAVTAKWAKGSGGPAGDEVQNVVAFTPGAAGRYGRPGFDDVSGNITTATGDNRMAVAVDFRGKDPVVDKTGAGYAVAGGDGGGAVKNYIMQTMVRRLTPLECERLQGFPDGYTKIKFKKLRIKYKPVSSIVSEDEIESIKEVIKPMSDSARYSMLGNSMAVNVMRWIGDRIKLFEEITG